jgi:heme oxygenase
MSLKEATWEHHKNAERQAFVKRMFKGDMSEKDYATYLYNQHTAYNILEQMAIVSGLLADMPEIRRAPSIHEDYLELWEDHENPPPLANVTKEYMDHIMKIGMDPHKLMAHLYVRHMGDLSGGQMIAKRVPGSGKYYQFEGDADEIKEKIRSKIDDSMADEAKVCFEFATRLFQELEEICA